MNDFGNTDRNDAITWDRKDAPAVDRDTQAPQKPHRGGGRWGGRLFATGSFLLLTGGVALGAWGYYSRQQEVMTTATHGSATSCPACAPQRSRRAPAPNPSPYPPRRPRSRTRTFMPAPPAISESAMSISAITSRQKSCWRSSWCRNLTNRSPKTRATLNQLQSALDQAQANLKLDQVTWGRDRPLVRDGWETQQHGTVDVQTLKAQAAAVASRRPMSQLRRNC